MEETEKMIDESMSGSRMKSGRTSGGSKEDRLRRMDKEKESRGIVVELREIRKVMKELVGGEGRTRRGKQVEQSRRARYRSTVNGVGTAIEDRGSIYIDAAEW
ncbi:hypothetical protein EAG_15505 [Camponotus floridanus]|uniref:Uncharacterized protein n=1 Tax=Camponotus floridanus TaxID=104421 RepID=E2AMA9_CAMFO|nr:hypothetical protein EAG_15505 [Camponotus floridanus]